MKRALFLDRDGTLIRAAHYLSDPNGVRILPGVPEALIRARDMGYLLFLFTNQSGVGRGYFSMEDVCRVNARMEELLELERPVFAAIGIAPEAPDQPVIMRKPSPRFILEMGEAYGLSLPESYMVGDSESDVLAGLRAGVIPVALATREEESPLEWSVVQRHKVAVFPDLLGFVKWLEEGEQEKSSRSTGPAPRD